MSSLLSDPIIVVPSPRYMLYPLPRYHALPPRSRFVNTYHHYTPYSPSSTPPSTYTLTYVARLYHIHCIPRRVIQQYDVIHFKLSTESRRLAAMRIACSALCQRPMHRPQGLIPCILESRPFGLYRSNTENLVYAKPSNINLGFMGQDRS